MVLQQMIYLKMLKQDMLHPLVQQMFKIASFCTDASRETLSTLVKASSTTLLYARRDRSDVVSNVSKIIQSGLSFFPNALTSLLAQKHLNSCRPFKMVLFAQTNFLDWHCPLHMAVMEIK